MKKKIKIILIRFASYLISVLPLLITIGINWKDYFPSAYGSVKLSFGAILFLLFVFLKSVGKLKLPEKRVVLYLIVFLFAYFLESVLYDLVLLSGMALLGEVLQLPLEKFADKKDEQMKIEKEAEITAKQLSEVLKKSETSGRV